MRRIIIVLLGILVVFFFAFLTRSSVGGPLCGPICPEVGPQYYTQKCIGLKTYDPYIDGYNNWCYGIPTGQRECFGVTAEKNIEKIDCELARK